MFSLHAVLAVIEASAVSIHWHEILLALKAKGMIKDGYVSQSDLNEVMGEF